MEEENQYEKQYNLRSPISLWKFLKQNSVDRNKSMNYIINEILEKYKKKWEKGIDR